MISAEFNTGVRHKSKDVEVIKSHSPGDTTVDPDRVRSVHSDIKRLASTETIHKTDEERVRHVRGLHQSSAVGNSRVLTRQTRRE